MTKAYAQVENYIRQAVVEGQYKPNDRLPTDVELAKELRVSRLTVHRALRGLAQEGLVRRGPRRGTIVADPRKHIVGTAALLIPSAMSTRASEWVTVLSEDLLRSGIALVPYNCHGTVERAVEIASLLARSQMVGAVVAPPTYEDSVEIVRILRDGGVTVVVEGKFDMPGTEVSYVSTNHRQGGRILGEHLLAVGHRRFGILTYSHTQDVKERCAGFQEALAQAGCEVRSNSMFEISQAAEIPFVIRELRARSDRPTAILGINDELAAEIMAVLHGMGLRIPDDCAVVGMGDEPMSKATLSPMTTVRAPLEKEGHLLAGVLLNTIQGRLTELQRIELDYTLVVRESCGVGRFRPAGAKE